MTTIDVTLLTAVTGGAAKGGLAGDMLRNLDDFARQLRRSSPKQVRALANCDYRVSEDLASGDPARIARAEQTNCRDLLAPARGRRR